MSIRTGPCIEERSWPGLIITFTCRQPGLYASFPWEEMEPGSTRERRNTVGGSVNKRILGPDIHVDITLTNSTYLNTAKYTSLNGSGFFQPDNEP